MQPILTPDEMAAVDAAAPEPVAELIARAGAAVAHQAIDLLGGTYGRRVVVLAGPGHNGDDGRDAAARLERRGVRTTVLDALGAPPMLPRCDLVIDAAFGTGFRGEHRSPLPPPGTPVLAVDIPSGVDGITGVASGRPLAATRTVTFAAFKPGLLLADGATASGEIVVVDIGLDTGRARAHLVEAADVRRWVPRRGPATHKWQHAVWIVAGSPGMLGAAWLAAAAAARGGAGYVRLSVPGVAAADVEAPIEAVVTDLPTNWAYPALEGLGRFGAAVVGNGLGVGERVDHEVRRFVRDATAPVVVDGDGLTALGAEAAACARPDTVVTPHDGEAARLLGRPVGPDRFTEVRRLAADLGCTALLKGPLTLIAAPDGSVRAVAEGTAQLATAGTGDVLAGLIGALLAAGAAPVDAAAAAAFLHGRAGRLGLAHGLVAGDLVELLPTALADLLEP